MKFYGKIYYIEVTSTTLKKRHYPNWTSYVIAGKPKLSLIKCNMLDNVQSGLDMPVYTNIVCTKNNNKKYYIENNKKREYKSSLSRALGPNTPDTKVSIDCGDIATGPDMPRFPPGISNGSTVRCEDGKIYSIKDNILYWYSDMNTYKNYGSPKWTYMPCDLIQKMPVYTL